MSKQTTTLKSQLEVMTPLDCYCSCLNTAVSSSNDESDKQVDTLLSHTSFFSCQVCSVSGAPRLTIFSP